LSEISWFVATKQQRNGAIFWNEGRKGSIFASEIIFHTKHISFGWFLVISFLVLVMKQGSQ
jgi:hypothetical protein